MIFQDRSRSRHRRPLFDREVPDPRRPGVTYYRPIGAPSSPPIRLRSASPSDRRRHHGPREPSYPPPRPPAFGDINPPPPPVLPSIDLSFEVDDDEEAPLASGSATPMPKARPGNRSAQSESATVVQEARFYSFLCVQLITLLLHVN